VFGNSKLRRIRVYGPNKAEMTGVWKIRHNEEVSRLYSLPNITQVIKSRRWAGHVANRGKVEVYRRFWRVNLRERDHLRVPGVDEMVILRWILRK
jgi:hypothetical protein